MSEEEIRLDQTKRVFDILAELISKNETCTYRYLIYDLLGFDGYYSTLISGLTITNALVEKEDLQQKVEQLENIRKEAIEYVEKNKRIYDIDGTLAELDEFSILASPKLLLNILNKVCN